MKLSSINKKKKIRKRKFNTKVDLRGKCKKKNITAFFTLTYVSDIKNGRNLFKIDFILILNNSSLYLVYTYVLVPIYLPGTCILRDDGGRVPAGVVLKPRQL